MKIKIKQISKLYEVESTEHDGLAYVCKIETEGFIGCIMDMLMIGMHPNISGKVSYIGIPINRTKKDDGIECFKEGWLYTDYTENIAAIQKILDPLLNKYVIGESQYNWLNIYDTASLIWNTHK